MAGAQRGAGAVWPQRLTGKHVPRRDHLDARAVALMVLLCSIWGSQQVAVKLGVAAGMPPVLQATLRTAGAALLCCFWIAARQGRAGLALLVRRDAFFVPGLWLALIVGLQFAMMFAALLLTTAGRSVLFIYTAPFYIALGTHFLVPSERMRPAQIAGLVAAFAGVAIAFGDGLFDGRGSLLGDLLSLAAGGLWAASSVLIKAVPGAQGVSAPRLLATQLGGAVPVLLAATFILGELHTLPAPTPLAWALVAYQTVVVAFASYLAWFELLLIYPAPRLSGFTFLTPLFGVLAGAVVLGEALTWPVLAGLAAIALGLRFVNPREAV